MTGTNKHNFSFTTVQTLTFISETHAERKSTSRCSPDFECT